jgi:Skp family chaperone for outer membrane proteins
VKRTIGIVVAVIALAVFAYVGSQLSAQQPTPAGPRPATPAAPVAGGKTRVSVFNLKFVVTSYWKWGTLQTQLETTVKGFEARAIPLKKQYEDTAKIVSDSKDAVAKEAAQKSLITYQRQMQDLEAEAKNTLQKEQSKMMMTLYNEVVGAATRYAVAHDLDLVMHYNDGSTTEEMNAPDNIYRKINTGACTPVFWKPEADISGDLVKTLNANAPPGTLPVKTSGAPLGGTPPVKPPQ